MIVKAHAELTIDVECFIDINSNIPIKDQVADYISINIIKGQIGGLNVLKIAEKD